MSIKTYSIVKFANVTPGPKKGRSFWVQFVPAAKARPSNRLISTGTSFYRAFRGKRKGAQAYVEFNGKMMLLRVDAVHNRLVRTKTIRNGGWGWPPFGKRRGPRTSRSPTDERQLWEQKFWRWKMRNRPKRKKKQTK